MYLLNVLIFIFIISYLYFTDTIKRVFNTWTTKFDWKSWKTLWWLVTRHVKPGFEMKIVVWENYSLTVPIIQMMSILLPKPLMLYLIINFFHLKEHVKAIDKEILHHHCLDEELGNESFGIPAIRHRKQQVSCVFSLIWYFW